MFGIVIGTLCFLALIGTLRHRHHYRYGHAFAGHDCGDGGGFGHGGGHGHGPGHHRGFEGRRGFGRFGMRGVRYALDLDDTQTDALRDVQLAIHTARDRAGDRVDSSRKALGDALAAETFDAQAVGHAFDAVLQSLDESRAALVAALGHAHKALSPEQRKRIARFITR